MENLDLDDKYSELRRVLNRKSSVEERAQLDKSYIVDQV
jgi:hypothetical protein